MVTDTEKTLALVISAIKNLREQKGSSTREILHYLSSVYNISPSTARRQMQTALKRGVAYGILKKDGGHYALSVGNDIKCQEIAEQELNLLDYCRRKSRQNKLKLCCKCKKRRRRRSRRKKRMCSCKRKKKRRRRRQSSRRCRSRSRRRRKRRKLCSCGGRKRAAIEQLKEQGINEKSVDPEIEAKDSASTVCSSVTSTVSSAPTT
ncbi:uncharacterized protein LOC143188707 [Calliopsis andreniformis]|uniref:uncharacterized protein LOC143188707 n=1 Tax=Calliopsis andreniformis TaxID=337506 RepID=UPI003FCC6369